MKITYKEYFNNENLERVTDIEGIEIKTQSDTVVKYDWDMLVEYYSKLEKEGVIDSVMIEPLRTHTNLNIIQYGTDGSQYHRVFTKWFE